MATIKGWLDGAGFNWHQGIVIVHETDSDSDSCSPGWDEAKSCDERTGLAAAHWEPIIREFDDGFGGPECPRFIAYDAYFVYFPSQYDGATGIVKVSLNPTFYVKIDNDGVPLNETPYPGGR